MLSRLCHALGRRQDDVKKLSGIMIPVYASVMLALIAVVAVSAGSRQAELVATTNISAATSRRDAVSASLLYRIRSNRRRRRAFDWSTIAVLALPPRRPSMCATGASTSSRSCQVTTLWRDAAKGAGRLPDRRICYIALPRNVARWVGHESGFSGLLSQPFSDFCCRAVRSPLSGGWRLPVMGADAARWWPSSELDADRIYARPGLGAADWGRFRDPAYCRGAAFTDLPDFWRGLSCARDTSTARTTHDPEQRHRVFGTDHAHRNKP